MPESPEVQALAEMLGERMVGRVISAVAFVDPRAVKTRDRPPASLVDLEVRSVRRFGKHIAFGCDGSWLVVGFGRSGWVVWSDRADSPRPDGSVGCIEFDDGTVLDLVERGAFLAVSLHVVDEPVQVAAIGGLGPDPLDPAFGQDDLERALGARRKQLKALLQEQGSIAGIGNGYSDEILHRAKLAHVVHAATLDRGQRDRLHDAVIEVMRGAAEARRGIPIDLLKQVKAERMVVHGRGGESCPVCGDVILDRPTGSTSTQFCPTCQPEP